MHMKIKPLLALAGTLILFSTYEIVSKTIAYQVPPLQINFWRFLFGGMLLLPVALVINHQAERSLTRADLFRLGRLGLVMVALSLPMLQQAITYIPASTAAVLFCTNPLFAHLFAAMLQGEKMSVRTWSGLLVSLTGISLIITSEIINLDFTWRILLGLGLSLASALFFGLYIVLAKGEAERVGGVTVNAITFIAGAIITLPLMLWFQVPLLFFDPAALPQMLYLTIGITCGAFLLFLYALQHLSAATSSLIFFIKPLSATLLAIWWLQEKATPTFMLGTVVVVAGLFFADKKISPPS